MPKIASLTGLEILDSRGRPTVKATCRLVGGACGSASVPSGASTGAAEAVELRDGDMRRYAGLGCLRAAANLGQVMQPALIGREFATQAEFDQALCELDGTPLKANLGANAILAASVAFARACAAQQGVPLYAHFANMAGHIVRRLPQLTINLFSGGKHAGGQVSIQDVLMVPVGGANIADNLALASAVYQAAVKLTAAKYGMRWLVADEGGLAPPAESSQALLDDALEAMQTAGCEPGRDMLLAVDVAASQFHVQGRYQLDGESLASEQMIERLAEWTRNYPLLSVEDGLAENDWPHWPLLAERLSPRTLTLGDDLLCTRTDRIRRAIAERSCNALLLKVNQVGTLTEALEACRLARSAGWQVVCSVRSGDTEDDWFADLAVGWQGDYTKIGSLTRSERLAKYNRLLEIEAELSGLK